VVAYLARIEDGGPVLVPTGLSDRGIGVVWNRDIGAVCARVLESEPPSGAYNVAFPDLSIRRFLEEAAAALGANPPRLVDVGEEALKNVGLKLGEVSPYGPYRERPGGYDLSLLRSELGFDPSPLGVALQDVVDWYRNDRPEAPGYGSREAELELVRRG
jgi:nucleoside-diphosphate-sugar epimerase